MIGPDELKKRFYPQFLTPEGLMQLEYVRERYLDLAESLDSLIPDGREKSEALTCLQTSSMFAVKGVCVDPKYWRKDVDVERMASDYDRGFQAGVLKEKIDQEQGLAIGYPPPEEPQKEKLFTETKNLHPSVKAAIDKIPLNQQVTPDHPLNIPRNDING